MPVKRIIVLGAGFAGLWSAIGAARKRAELDAENSVEITVVNRTPYHNIRVRNYEPDLSDVCVPLDEVLGPIGVKSITGEVDAIDVEGHRVSVTTSEGTRSLGYDRLVIALGSELDRPAVPGLAEYGFDVDTYAAATRLDQHLKTLSSKPASSGRFTAVVVGAGLTGIEAAAELPARLRAAQAGVANAEAPQVVLVDRRPVVGSDMGESARPVIEEALRTLGVRQRVNVGVEQVGSTGVRLSSGEWIDAATVVWCTGMRASPLLGRLPCKRDRLGRLLVDEFMRVMGIPDVYAAGDAACASIDGVHSSVMSCQHGRPMGRYAGHNVAADLLGAKQLPLFIDWYTTVLDLGAWGAVQTWDWDRRVIATGSVAKATKETINRLRIYPPRSRIPSEILAAAVPEIQRPPASR